MYTLKDITRPSGGFAMLAVDQREAMRLMFAAAGAPVPVTDQHLTDFKVNAAKILSPYASAILVDQQFCYRQIVEQQAVAKSCAMIVAADEFIPGNGIPVDSVVIDKNIDAQAVKRDGGKALKLLVLWRPQPVKERAIDEDRMPGPKTVKVVKNSQRGGQRPEIKMLRVLGNQRLTPGGQIKRAKKRKPTSVKKRQAD